MNRISFLIILHQAILIASSSEARNNSSSIKIASSEEKNNSSSIEVASSEEKNNSSSEVENGNITLTLVNIRTKDGDDNKKKEMLYSLAQNQYPSGGPNPYGQFIPGGQGSPLPPVLLNALRQRQLALQQQNGGRGGPLTPLDLIAGFIPGAARGLGGNGAQGLSPLQQQQLVRNQLLQRQLAQQRGGFQGQQNPYGGNGGYNQPNRHVNNHIPQGNNGGGNDGGGGSDGGGGNDGGESEEPEGGGEGEGGEEGSTEKAENPQDDPDLKSLQRLGGGNGGDFPGSLFPPGLLSPQDLKDIEKGVEDQRKKEEEERRRKEEEEAERERVENEGNNENENSNDSNEGNNNLNNHNLNGQGVGQGGLNQQQPGPTGQGYPGQQVNNYGQQTGGLNGATPYNNGQQAGQSLTPGYPPQINPGYPSQVNPGYPPQVNPGYPPQINPGLINQVNPALISQVTNQLNPALLNQLRGGVPINPQQLPPHLQQQFNNLSPLMQQQLLQQQQLFLQQRQQQLLNNQGLSNQAPYNPLTSGQGIGGGANPLLRPGGINPLTSGVNPLTGGGINPLSPQTGLGLSGLRQDPRPRVDYGSQRENYDRDDDRRRGYDGRGDNYNDRSRSPYRDNYERHRGRGRGNDDDRDRDDYYNTDRRSLHEGRRPSIKAGVDYRENSVDDGDEIDDRRGSGGRRGHSNHRDEESDEDDGKRGIGYRSRGSPSTERDRIRTFRTHEGDLYQRNYHPRAGYPSTSTSKPDRFDDDADGDSDRDTDRLERRRKNPFLTGR